MTKQIDLAFSFDMTGSMRPCAYEVKRKVKEITTRLFRDIPGLRISLTAHKDYCDAHTSYVTKRIDLTRDPEEIKYFMQSLDQGTGGGDAPECYELVLHQMKTLNWRPEAEKIVVLIGDDVPHRSTEGQNYLGLDWEREASDLNCRGMIIHSVQCLGLRYANSFYRELANIGDGSWITLHQFHNIVELIHAVAYKQVGEKAFQKYVEELDSMGKINRAMATMLDALSGKKTFSTKLVSADLEAVPLGRFQVLNVDRSMGIKAFVQESEADFRIGRGFYEHTKTEMVQERKEVVLMHKKTGDMYTGAKAREMIGLPYGERQRIKPAFLPEYDVFIQSTSWNRKLVPSKRLLYEVKGWMR